MREYLPVLIVAAIISVFATVFVAAYLRIKIKKEALGFDRHMEDGELIRRLLKYAVPYKKQFVLVLGIMLVSIAYDLASPLIVGAIEEMIKDDFQLGALGRWVLLYAGILIVSLICTYFQAIILQRTGQRILSALRQDLFVHIESLSHEQLNQIPVGKLVTRVTNDTNAISMMFTNILVNMAKNVFVVVGVLAAMLMLNYALTLMVLCFVPFLVLFTVIFRKFTRKVFRVVKDRTTDINTYLSENLSGIKITQVFNQEERKMADFLRRSNDLKKAKQNQIFVFGIFRPMVYMLYISSVLCLLYLGGRGYIKGGTFLGQSFTSGVIVSFYMYVNKFFNPIQNLAEQFNQLQSAFASAEKIFTIFDMKPEVVDEPGAIELEEIRGEIEFKSASTSSPGRPWPSSAPPAPARPPSSTSSAATTTSRRGRSSSTASTSAISRSPPCASTSGRCSRTCSSSPARSAATSCCGRTASPTRRSGRPAATSAPTPSSIRWRTAWTRPSGSGATTSPPDSGSSSALPAPSSTARRS